MQAETPGATFDDEQETVAESSDGGPSRDMSSPGAKSRAPDPTLSADGDAELINSCARWLEAEEFDNPRERAEQL